MPLEDAPRKYTKQLQLKLNAVQLTEEKLRQVFAIVSQHPGKCPLFLCIRQPGGEQVYVEANERYQVAASRDFQRAIEELFGADAYHPRVDTSVPERQKRAWEKREREPAMAGD
jgi:hypothetical protein